MQKEDLVYHPNACCIVALCYVSQKSADTVMRIARFYGYREDYGMDDPDWIASAVQLGIKLKGMRLPRGIKLKDFDLDGLFFVGTKDHLFVLDNGIVFDPRNEYSPGLNRKITGIWRVDEKGI